MVRRKIKVKKGGTGKPFFQTHDLEQERDERDELTGRFKEKPEIRAKHREEMKEEREAREAKKPAALKRLKEEREEDEKASA